MDQENEKKYTQKKFPLLMTDNGMRMGHHASPSNTSQRKEMLNEVR